MDCIVHGVNEESDTTEPLSLSPRVHCLSSPSVPPDLVRWGHHPLSEEETQLSQAGGQHFLGRPGERPTAHSHPRHAHRANQDAGL